MRTLQKHSVNLSGVTDFAVIEVFFFLFEQLRELFDLSFQQRILFLKIVDVIITLLDDLILVRNWLERVRVIKLLSQMELFA